MNTPNITTRDDAELGAHLRHTLLTVAETIHLEQAHGATRDGTDDLVAIGGVSARDESIRARSTGGVQQPTGRSRRLSGRNIAIAAAMIVMSLGVLGWKALGQGDIERIPTEAALVTGTAEGYEWWLIPSEAIAGHSNPCGVPFPGVELVSAATNRPGEQWNTGGVNYGQPDPSGTHTPIDGQSGMFTYDCTNPTSDFNEAAWLSDPVLHDVGFTRLGRGDDAGSPWAAFVAVHPSIDHIDVIADGQVIETVATVAKVDEPNGARYAGFTIPSDVCTFELNYLDGTQSITTDPRTLC